MSYYDNNFLHDHSADNAAIDELRREHLAEKVEITPEELSEHVAALNTPQFLQFYAQVLESFDPCLQHLIRNVICADLIAKKVNEQVNK